MTDEEKQAKIDELLGKLHELAKVESPEAGGIAFTELYSSTGAKYNVTARGGNTWTALQEMVYTVQLAGLVLGMRTTKPEPPAATPPAIPADQRIAREEGNPALAAELHAEYSEVPPSKSGKPYQVVQIQTVEIQPKPDNRVSVLFFADGHRYADAQVNNWKLDSAAGLLKHVTGEPLDKPAKLTLPCKVYATEGKEYSKRDGSMGHYLDIEHVRPA